VNGLLRRLIFLALVTLLNLACLWLAFQWMMDRLLDGHF
jgi:hypothetical protein